MIRPAPRRQAPQQPAPPPRSRANAQGGRGSRIPATRKSPQNGANRAVPAPQHLRDAAPRRKETDIQRAILDYLATVPGVMAQRMNSRVVRMPGKGGRSRLVRFGFKGCPDILGWVEMPCVCGAPPLTLDREHSIPMFLAIEVKAPGRGPTPEQERFLQDVQTAGGLGIVAYSVDDVRRALGR